MSGVSTTAPPHTHTLMLMTIIACIVPFRAFTRHHGESLRYGNSFPSTFPEDLLAHASPNDWPIVAKHANMSSRGSINAAPATITSAHTGYSCQAAVAAVSVHEHVRSYSKNLTLVALHKSEGIPFNSDADHPVSMAWRSL